MKIAWILVLLPATSSAAMYGKLPLSFEPNLGQTGEQVRFVSRAGSYGLFLVSDGVVFDFDGGAVRKKLAGAKTPGRITGLERLPGQANYLIGRDPDFDLIRPHR